jgi:hypothetical protein
MRDLTLRRIRGNIVERYKQQIKRFEVSDTVHLFSMDERKTNLMHLLYIFIVAVGDALLVSGVFAHRQER